MIENTGWAGVGGSKPFDKLRTGEPGVRSKNFGNFVDKWGLFW
jgi:hypothetical protein